MCRSSLANVAMEDGEAQRSICDPLMPPLGVCAGVNAMAHILLSSCLDGDLLCFKCLLLGGRQKGQSGATCVIDEHSVRRAISHSLGDHLHNECTEDQKKPAWHPL